MQKTRNFSQGLLASTCLVLGLLAFLPYVFIWVSSMDSPHIFNLMNHLFGEKAIVLYIIPLISGIPCAALGIYLGIVASTEKPKELLVLLYFGFLLNILGIIGNIALIFYALYMVSGIT